MAQPLLPVSSLRKQISDAFLKDYQVYAWLLQTGCAPAFDFVSPTIRAGTPATIAKSGTSRVTTAPAPTSAYSPIVTPGTIVALEPIDARRLTRVGMTFQSSSVIGEPSKLVAFGKGSFVNITPWPIKTSSSMTTPSQMKL